MKKNNRSVKDLNAEILTRKKLILVRGGDGTQNSPYGTFADESVPPLGNGDGLPNGN